MNSRSENIDALLSMPAASVSGFTPWSTAAANYFISSDPPGSQLGSGGGTAYLLQQAWQASGEADFTNWLRASRKLIVHGSGQSRRLPAYAAEGKPLLPIPHMPAATAQAPDQRLIDWQENSYTRILRHAPACYRVMVTCGDVLLTNDSFTPSFPEADVLIVGIRTTPDEARNHGVMFCEDGDNNEFEFFLQKPPLEKTTALAESHRFYLDTGVWLLSAKAVLLLAAKCGWLADKGTFRNNVPDKYELFDRFGLALGSAPVAPDPAISALKAAVLPLPAGRFFHFGTNRSIITSTMALAQRTEGNCAIGHTTSMPYEHCVAVNAAMASKFDDENHLIWVENSVIPATWKLHERHVITGVPENEWSLDMPAGVCLDCIKMRDHTGLCLRVYGFDDPFRGALAHRATTWMGVTFATWLAERALTFQRAGLDPAIDIQAAPLFPVIDPAAPSCARLITWMMATQPASDPEMTALWLQLPRVSAADLLQHADIRHRAHQRTQIINREIERAAATNWLAACNSLDLAALAQRVQENGIKMPPPLDSTVANGAELAAVHDTALREHLPASVLPQPNAVTRLRNLLVSRLALKPVAPHRAVGEDQIVWGRAPVRLDFAGGWSDTPPYCLEHGGLVTNIAVNLNGQPPVQAFARICKEPHLVIHSIDLGVSEVITTNEDLLAVEKLGSGFGIARAALRLAGFGPEFNASGRRLPLSRFLQETLGGGVELTMLAAIPKGSGLGTSSILAASLLGTLSNLCGLGWDEQDLFIRTLALEQILTSGGGWQDQVGGVVSGLKIIKSQAGLLQKPVVRWLPSQMIESAIADHRFQLYYTGITRVAHNILGEIVQGLFLNDASRLHIIDEIAMNAKFTSEALQRHDWPGFVAAVKRSWLLNRLLDKGTNPPEVAAIINRINPWLAASKLTGAGGGGYMILLSDTTDLGLRLRQELESNPPNPRARFVKVSVSHTGLEVTRS